LPGEFAESAQHRNKILSRGIVIDYDNQRVGVAAQKHEQQGFRRG